MPLQIKNVFNSVTTLWIDEQVNMRYNSSMGFLKINSHRLPSCHIIRYT